jgi:hypothetical protein
MRALALVIALSSVARADTRGTTWLRERGTLEWVTAAGGWRTGLSSDQRVPGFEALAGGTELSAGIELYAGLALILNGRFLGGQARGQQFLDGAGGIGLQLRVSDWVRLRAGAAAGQIRAGVPNDLRGPSEITAVTVGGWLAASIDLFVLGGHLATSISLRLDVDALLAESSTVAVLPDQSLALALGLGFRY